MPDHKKKREAEERRKKLLKTKAAKTKGTINVNARRLYLKVEGAEDYPKEKK